MKYKIVSLLVCLGFLGGCVGTKSQVNTVPPSPQEITIKVQAAEPTKLTVEDNTKDAIRKAMEVDNPEGSLSVLSFISGNKAFMKIFSGLSVSDVSYLWNDFVVLENSTDIRDVHIFINSPGGSAFAGLALADQIERVSTKFNIHAHASGIVASAAVPVFAVCDNRYAAEGTVFMVHEAAIWKWPGRETASDIRAQNELMDLLRDRYIGKLVDNTNLTEDEWAELEKKTTWFGAEEALEWGLVDRIE